MSLSATDQTAIPLHFLCKIFLFYTNGAMKCLSNSCFYDLQKKSAIIFCMILLCFFVQTTYIFYSTFGNESDCHLSMCLIRRVVYFASNCPNLCNKFIERMYGRHEKNQTLNLFLEEKHAIQFYIYVLYECIYENIILIFNLSSILYGCLVFDVFFRRTFRQKTL